MDRNFQLADGSMNRNDWEFEYTAATLAKAAEVQRDYRQSRILVWEQQKDDVMTKIKETGLTVHEGIAAGMANYTQSNTGGAQVLVDATLQRDLNECASKIRSHRDAMQEYEAWFQVLSANPEARLKLKHNDWQFSLGNKEAAVRRTETPMPSFDLRLQRSATRPHALHRSKNPAGSKLLRAFYKTKTGARGTYAEARLFNAQRKK